VVVAVANHQSPTPPAWLVLGLYCCIHATLDMHLILCICLCCKVFTSPPFVSAIPVPALAPRAFRLRCTRHIFIHEAWSMMNDSRGRCQHREAACRRYMYEASDTVKHMTPAVPDPHKVICSRSQIPATGIQCVTLDEQECWKGQ
jgi:hypothetical protein